MISTTDVGESFTEVRRARGSSRKLHRSADSILFRNINVKSHTPEDRRHSFHQYSFSSDCASPRIFSPSLLSSSPFVIDEYLSPEAHKLINRQKYVRSYTFSSSSEENTRQWFRKKKKEDIKKHAKNYSKSKSLKACFKFLFICFIVKK